MLSCCRPLVHITERISPIIFNKTMYYIYIPIRGLFIGKKVVNDLLRELERRPLYPIIPWSAASSVVARMAGLAEAPAPGDRPGPFEFRNRISHPAGDAAGRVVVRPRRSSRPRWRWWSTTRACGTAPTSAALLAADQREMPRFLYEVLQTPLLPARWDEPFHPANLAIPVLHHARLPVALQALCSTCARSCWHAVAAGHCLRCRHGHALELQDGLWLHI